MSKVSLPNEDLRLTRVGADLLAQVVDHVMPLLPPYETSVYVYLLRRSRLVGEPSIRVGKRTIGEGLGKGTRSSRGNYEHIADKLKNLVREGFITVGDTDRLGTLYRVALPEEVPAVREHMALAVSTPAPGNYFHDSELRQELFERDQRRCAYCGDLVPDTTATLDHVVPVSRDGTDDPTNLVTCCLLCNSIKSGRSYEEAAPDLLRDIRARRTRETEAASGQ